MKAVVLTGHGGPEVLQVQERPDPPVGPGEVRIDVKAAGINFADTMARVGLYPEAPKPPCVVGYEVAGDVESVGDGVESVKGGDKVMAGTRFGGQASMVTVPESQVFPLPDGFSYEQGAAFPVNYSTSYVALVMMGGLREGDLRHTDSSVTRGRDLRHRVGLEARCDPRAGRSARDRLPQPGLRAGDQANHRR
jgi:NADPH:quinone reductase-like Zn-dependent oxidoreductase